MLKDEQDQEGVGLGESMLLCISVNRAAGTRVSTVVDLNEPEDWDATHSGDLIEVHAGYRVTWGGGGTVPKVPPEVPELASMVHPGHGPGSRPPPKAPRQR